MSPFWFSILHHQFLFPDNAPKAIQSIVDEFPDMLLDFGSQSTLARLRARMTRAAILLDELYLTYSFGKWLHDYVVWGERGPKGLILDRLERQAQSDPQGTLPELREWLLLDQSFPNHLKSDLDSPLMDRALSC